MDSMSSLTEHKDQKELLKRGIWLYFLLLIFEGALRKWFLPEFSTPLLIIRDPVALFLLFLSWKKGVLTINVYIQSMLAIGILGIATALLFGHGDLTVALYGARVLLIHFPLIFVIGSVFDRADVIRMGKAFLWLSIPMAILIAFQYYSPQSAWVNRGLGGDLEGAGFSGAMGFYRPPGTFSFTNGNTLFFSLLSSFVLFFLVSNTKVNPLLLLASTIALLVSIPLSISRTLLFSFIITLVFVAFIFIKNPHFKSKHIFTGLGVIILIVALSQTTFFQSALDVLATRFENASNSEGGLKGTLVDRFLMGDLVRPFTNIGERPFFGYGIGMGTQAGNKLLVGERGFAISEGEWGRLLGEMGFLLGGLVIFIRLHFTLNVGYKAYKKIVHFNYLPWMLLSFGIINIPTAQWGQPTALGFSALVGGLIIASLKATENDSDLIDKN